MTPTQIPDGYELLVGRGKENANKALALAEERGFEPSSVSVSPILGGFLVPLGGAEEVEAQDLGDLTVAELKALAEKAEIDLGDATKKADIIAVIEASPKVPTLSDETVGDTQKED